MSYISTCNQHKTPITFYGAYDRAYHDMEEHKIPELEKLVEALKTDVSFLMSVAQCGERLSDADLMRLRTNLNK